MAAYAVVVSLKETLELLLDSARSRFQNPNSELKLIYDDLCYVKSFFDKMVSFEDSYRVQYLEKQIKDVVQTIQDLIETYLSDLVHSGSGSSISGLSLELGEVNLGLFVKMLKDMEDYLTGEQPSPTGGSGNGRNNKTVGLADVAGSSTIDFSRNDEIVGLYKERRLLLHGLTRDSHNREVICIAGMAGIGKTTLAKMVCRHPLIEEHFHICLFVEIGVEYQLKNLLMRLVGQLVSEEMKKLMTVGELGEQLYKYLYGRKYLVVLDDIWDTEAWYQIRRYFPDDRNGSRIIYTTTGVTDLPNYMILHMHFLDDHESWELFCKMVFGEEACPVELENTGKAVVEKLGGLPLAIVMIGNLLSKLHRTVENWMAVAQNIRLSIRESTIPAFLNVCYTQLPQRLKACFLYLGLFPPNYSIPTSQIIRLWVAEGLIEPAADRSLEQKAEEYLKDLISIGLVIVDQLSSIGRMKTFRFHQLLQELCVAEARQQKLFDIVNEGTTEVTKNQRRLGIHCSDIVPEVMETVSGVRSLVFICSENQEEVFVWFKWLRVLHAPSIRFQQFPDEVLKLVWLRYLDIAFNGDLPPSISRLWNLEVLIIHATQILDSSMFLPLDIWKLQKLRHLILDPMGFYLPEPPIEDGNGGSHLLFLRKLQTLTGVRCSKGILARMPNLIKLRIWFEPTDDADADFTHLHKLESLNLTIKDRSSAAFGVIRFPSAIRKLTLSRCEFLRNGGMMAILSCLPNLEVLKLRRCTFSGRELEVAEGGEFRMLQFLALEDLDIKRFKAGETKFPRLRRLLIRRCYELKGIPIDIGEIPTLQLIEVDDCSESVVASAELIREEQRAYGNYDLQVRIHSSPDLTTPIPRIRHRRKRWKLNFKLKFKICC